MVLQPNKTTDIVLIPVQRICRITKYMHIPREELMASAIQLRVLENSGIMDRSWPTRYYISKS